jgi:23S rRNA (cytidine2498-2'-O)-methyltransferase
MTPAFYCAACQVGAEKVVKAEVAAEHPGLRFAFSRPGFVTFKDEAASGPPLVLRKSVFARYWARVLGRATSMGDMPGLLALIPPGGLIQCFERDLYFPGDEPASYARDARIRALEAAIPGAEWRGVPRPGDEVYSLIWIDDFLVYLARHVHSGDLLPEPGNIPRLSLPEASPSRAWLKLEEAILRFKPATRMGLEVLEIGCSPGGATMAMLDRGFKVLGVDPKALDPSVGSRPGFSLIKKQAKYVEEGDLRDADPEWIVMDMSIAPFDALDELAHVVKLLRRLRKPGLRLRHGFLTIKLNDWRFADAIPEYLARLERMGFRGLRPMQLCSNRQEFFVWAAGFE